jgi:thioredoxin 1
MFFLNPNGRPCKMQIQILEEMKDQLGDVPVERVSVLDQTSRPTLYQYGIRALPALILVDDQGRELHRFSPGIQSASSIMAAIEGANGA